jgi:hypothetical protein
MSSNHFIRVCGSISKKESLVPLVGKGLKDICTAEANLPYSNYYGSVPGSINPNSLFLFTAEYYTLEEILRFSQKITLNSIDKLNVAAANIIFKNHHYPAIRIKFLPDYSLLKEIQISLKDQGVVFAKKLHLENEALVKINKCFILEEIDNGIYMDYEEENKGYIAIDKLLTEEEFEYLFREIKNNGNCKLFDAAKGGMIIHSEVNEVMRVYSEHLDLKILQCIQNHIHKILNIQLHEHH